MRIEQKKKKNDKPLPNEPYPSKTALSTADDNNCTYRWMSWLSGINEDRN